MGRKKCSLVIFRSKKNRKRTRDYYTTWLGNGEPPLNWEDNLVWGLLQGGKHMAALTMEAYTIVFRLGEQEQQREVFGAFVRCLGWYDRRNVCHVVNKKDR